MKQVQVERNIRLFYIYQVLREPLFWGPILILYINKVSGMSLSAIYFMEAIVLLMLMFLEIPSGAIADLIGRRRAMLIGYVILTGDNLAFWLADNPVMIWTADIVWVIGFALVSGADSALLYDSLLYLDRAGDYKKIFGRSTSYRFAATAIGSVASGYLYNIHICLPIALSTIFIAINIAVIFFLVEPLQCKNRQYNWREYLETIYAGFSVIRRIKLLPWIIGCTVLIQTISKLWFFSYNMYFELVRLPVVYFGWIFCILNLVSALVSRNAHRLERFFSQTGSMILMLTTVTVPLLAMSYIVHQLSCLQTVWQNISRGYIDLFSNDEIHTYAKNGEGATAISVKSAMVGIGQFIGLMLFSFSLNKIGLLSSLQILGWWSLMIGFFLIYFFHKKHGKNQQAVQ